jgi:hypothetical protein
MAYPDDRYWVGGSNSWTPTNTFAWSTTSGGPGGASVPTSANNVFFDQAGTYSVNLSNTESPPCANLTVSAGSVTFTGFGPSVYGSISVVAATTFTNTVLFLYSASSATITTNGSQLPIISLQAAGPFTLQDNLTIKTGSYFRIAASSTLNLNDKTLTTPSFADSLTSATTVTVNFGTGGIVINAGISGTLSLSGSYTFTGSKSISVNVGSGSATIYYVVISSASTLSVNNAANVTVTGSNTTYIYGQFNNLNLSGYTGVDSAGSYFKNIFGDLTLSSAYNAGSSFVAMKFAGTTATQKITSNGCNVKSYYYCSTSQTVQLQDALSTTLGFVLGTSSIASTLDLNNKTLTCGYFYYESGQTIAFGTGNITINSSQTGDVFSFASGASMPTLTGTPVVNFSSTRGSTESLYFYGNAGATASNSFSLNVTSGSYTLNIYDSVQNLNFTGFSGSAVVSSTTCNAYGDLTLASAMTNVSGNVINMAKSTGTQTITSNTRSIACSLRCNANNLTFADNLTSTGGIVIQSGTVDLNAKTFAFSSMSVALAVAKNLIFNGGTISLTGGYTALSSALLTTTAGTGTGKIRFTGSNAKTFAGGGFTYNCTISNDGSGALTISGNNTIQTLANGTQPVTINIANGATQTITNFNLAGTAGNLVTLKGSTAGGQGTISCATQYIDMSYLAIQDITATGGAAWYANTTSVNNGNNNGIIFSTPEKFFLLLA